jgi:hypothetical protein
MVHPPVLLEVGLAYRNCVIVTLWLPKSALEMCKTVSGKVSQQAQPEFAWWPKVTQPLGKTVATASVGSCCPRLVVFSGVSGPPRTFLWSLCLDFTACVYQVKQIVVFLVKEIIWFCLLILHMRNRGQTMSLGIWGPSWLSGPPASALPFPPGLTSLVLWLL